MMRENASFLFTVLFVAIAGIPACNPSGTPPPSNHETYSGQETFEEGSIQIKLEIKHDSGAIFARVIFTNSTARDVSMLKRNLLCDYEGRMTFAAFKVTRDGKKVPYRGLCVKRGPPTKDDWYSLEPGQSYETTIPISDVYDFSSPGEYDVLYRAYQGEFAGHLVLLESNTVRIVIPK